MSRNLIELFVEAFPTAAGQALSGKSKAAWIASVDEKAQPFPAGTEHLTLVLVAEPSKAEAAIQISHEDVLSLVAAIGGTATPPPQFKPEHAQAVQAIFAEACEKAALEGTRVNVQIAKSLSWAPAKQFSMTAKDGGSKKVAFQLLFSVDWEQSSSIATPAPAAKGVNVSLLENVEIAVTLQFGERRLPLREIGELRSGSVIELDKYLQDPADLLLGDRVVARARW